MSPQSKPANIFFDTEFLAIADADGTGHLTPLSIGMCSGGHNLYLEYETDLNEIGRKDPWLINNVIKHLRGKGAEVLTRAQIASRITRWVTKITHHPTFWAYRSASDWACLFNTYGGFSHLPPCFGKSCRDLAIIADHYRQEEHAFPEATGISHLAIADAQWNQRLHNHFVSRNYLPAEPHYG